MKTLIGTVVSTKMTGTAAIMVETRWQHPTYKKTVKRTKKYLAGNSTGAAEGDKVEIIETRPTSKFKRWDVTKVLTKATK